ncbi:MAG: hypothetical protein R3C45_05805 [Phycisphaerales bacterium]
MPRRSSTISPGFWRWHRRHVRRATCWLVGIGGFTIVTAALFIFQNADICGALSAVGGSLFLLSLPSYIYRLKCKLRVVPYFENPVDGPCTYLMGESLLNNSLALDIYLLECRMLPISSFNSGDDFLGETLVWHDPHVALPVVNQLLSAIQSNHLAINDAVAVENDLKLLAEKLRIAEQSKIKFCLLLQDNGGTNHQEHVMRKGAFFERRHRE